MFIKRISFFLILFSLFLNAFSLGIENKLFSKYSIDINKQANEFISNKSLSNIAIPSANGKWSGVKQTYTMLKLLNYQLNIKSNIVKMLNIFPAYVKTSSFYIMYITFNLEKLSNILTYTISSEILKNKNILLNNKLKYINLQK